MLKYILVHYFYGYYAVYQAYVGNHEYYCGQEKALAFYRDARINLLRDGKASACGLTVIGRDDATNRKSVAELVSDIPAGSFTILLDHQPKHLDEAQAAGIDWQFSGHTHHGQIWPVSWITDRIYEDAFGLLQKGSTNYYVTSGIGLWGPPYRIGTRSEYVVLDIRRPAARPDGIIRFLQSISTAGRHAGPVLSGRYAAAQAPRYG